MEKFIDNREKKNKEYINNVFLYRFCDWYIFKLFYVKNISRFKIIYSFLVKKKYLMYIKKG